MDRKKELVHAFITVLITVPCFITYCLSIENGGIMNINPKMIICLIPIEFILAFLSEVLFVGKIAFKLAQKAMNDGNYPPKIYESAIICATVCVMCPWMSFLATILYKGIFPGIIYSSSEFQIIDFFKYFIPNFLQTVVLNIPFALIGQLFFIQPCTRKIMSKLYK